MSDSNIPVPSSTLSNQSPHELAPAPRLGAANAGPPRKTATQQPEIKDNFREIVETVVFVVVLVLLLKSFVAEAFVIPTGSMAETLWGYQKLVECPKCHHQFPVNCSSEVEPSELSRRTEVTGAVCPNCRYDISFAQDGIDPHWKSGDRVLVS